jgi:CheY-like chemotaxis protein
LRERSPDSRIRVLLVDDSADFLGVVSEWLEADPQIAIVGTADSGTGAVAEAARQRPDVVLMDVSMPGINGFEATRRIKQDPDAPVVILLTFHDSETARNEAWAAGADDLIAKAHVTDGLLESIRKTVAHRRAPEKKPRSNSPTKRVPPRDIHE